MNDPREMNGSISRYVYCKILIPLVLQNVFQMHLPSTALENLYLEKSGTSTYRCSGFV
jgi:hypothetical protein